MKCADRDACWVPFLTSRRPNEGRDDAVAMVSDAMPDHPCATVMDPVTTVVEAPPGPCRGILQKPYKGSHFQWADFTDMVLLYKAFVAKLPH